MTDRELLELAEQADLITSAGIVHYAYADRLERFAALVRRDALLEARTACLKYTFASYAADEIAALAAKEES